jgi:hypothetical protein
MPTLSELTDRIIAQRDENRVAFNDRKKQLDRIKNNLDAISTFKSNPNWQVVIDENQCGEDWAKLLELSDTISSSVKQVTAYNGTFTLAKARADRNFVNIGAVGITKEGKSEFTAKIAKLDKNIMPRRAGNNSCTTARINIINGSSKDGKSDIARVYYYSVKQLAELLYSYLVELGDPNPDNALKSITTREGLQSWVRSNKRAIDNSTEIGRGERGGKKNAFMEYLNNVSDYINYLIEDKDLQYLDDGSFKECENITYRDYDLSELIQNKSSVVNEYYSSVCYFKNPDESRKQYKSYATRKAEIYWTFDVGNEGPIRNLQFLDTPGIGEDKPGLERILANAVSSELDIILAIKAAKPDEQQDTVRNMLVTQLRTHLNGRPKSQNALYFIVNLWNAAKFSDGVDEQRKLKKRLENTQDLAPIKLGDDHFRYIQIRDEVEVKQDDVTNTNKPIQSYLLDICQKIIPSISEIDKEYFSDAITAYDAIMAKYQELESLIARINRRLPDDDISVRIDEILTNVGKEWEIVASKIKESDLIDNIGYTINEFCNNPTGKVVAELFESEDAGISDFDADDDNYTSIDEFCAANDDKISLKYKRAHWQTGDDFKQYADIKKELLSKIEETIFSRIDIKAAIAALDAKKVELAKVFMETGKLSALCADENTWWGDIAQIIKAQNYPAIDNGTSKQIYLYEAFEEFANLMIDYRKQLKSTLDGAADVYGHSDDFGEDERYNFSSYDSSKRAIIHSLLCIENKAQTKIKQEVLEREMNKIFKVFNSCIIKIGLVNNYANQHEKTKEREQWVQFYKTFAKEIFANDENEQKQALISTWNKLI